MFKLDLEKAENWRSNCWHPLDHRKSERIPEKHLLLLYWLCQSLCADHNKLESLPRDGNTRPPYLPPEKYVGRFKKQQLEPDMEQRTGSKLGKEYTKALYCHPACYKSKFHRVHHAKCQAGWSTSWNQDCRRNTNNLRYADDTTLMAESDKELNSLLMKVREESE